MNLTHEELLLKLQEIAAQWLQGQDWEKYDDFTTGYDEGQWRCSLELRKLIDQEVQDE